MTILSLAIRAGLFAQPGQPRTYPGALGSQTVSLAVGPIAIVPEWVYNGFPTVRVEKGYGSGVFQDLYPDSANNLYTEPKGAGTLASTWAGASKLLVEIPYNQAATDLGDASHPAKISDSKRVLLDVSVSGAPFFAGVSTGSQDASQDATIRGYTSTETYKQLDYFTAWTLATHAAGEEQNLIQDNAGGTTARLRSQDAGSKRHYFAPNNNVASFVTATYPHLATTWQRDLGYKKLPTGIWLSQQNWGVVHEAGAASSGSSTVRTLNIMGPTNTLAGKLYALVVAKGDVPRSFTGWTGASSIPKQLAATASKVFSAGQFVIVFPAYNNQVIAMDLQTQTADIPIKLVGQPGVAFEASWNGGAYIAIGSTNSSGVLDGALHAQAMGNGTLSVRDVATATAVTRTNIAVGVKIAVCGESNPDGRGTNVTITIPAGNLRKNGVNWTAASNEYWKLLCQNIYDHFGANCVVDVWKVTIGGSYLCRYSGDNGQWDPTSAALSVVNEYNRSIAMFSQANFEIAPPNFIYFDLGRNDAAIAPSAASIRADFVTYFDILAAAYRTEFGSNIPIAICASGENFGTSAARNDAVRAAQIALWDAGDIVAAGSQAHIDADLDGVHYDTEVQKQKVCDVMFRYFRHLWNGGSQARAPQYSSAVKGSDTCTVTFIGGTSPLTHSGGDSEVLGWSASDGSGALTVNTAVPSGLDVVLTFNRAISGTLTLQWCSDNTGIGTTLLDSDATTPCPPEPFGPVSI